MGIIQNHKGALLLLGEVEGGLRVCQREGRGREEEREEEEHPVSLMGFVWGGQFAR